MKYYQYLTLKTVYMGKYRMKLGYILDTLQLLLVRPLYQLIKYQQKGKSK